MCVSDYFMFIIINAYLLKKKKNLKLARVCCKVQFSCTAKGKSYRQNEKIKMRW